VHGGSRYEPVALGHDRLGTGVLAGESTEDTGADFFLAVLEEGGFADNSVDHTLVADSEFLLGRDGSLLLIRNVHGHRA